MHQSRRAPGVLRCAPRNETIHQDATRWRESPSAAALSSSSVSVIEQVRSDVNSAMKAGERERAAALRMVLSELQKAAKEGGEDELAVLRRERKRRLEAASQFREAGRSELAGQEESEAELISGYLPAELSDADLEALVSDAIAETGASDPKDMGTVMKAAMARAQGRADGKRVSARVRDALSGQASRS